MESAAPRWRLFTRRIGIHTESISRRQKVIRREYRFKLLDFSINILAPMLRKEGKKPTRRNLARLATKLRKKHGVDILAKRLCKKIKKDRDYVISGVRFPEEVIYIEKQFGVDFILVGIECRPRIRYERAKKTGIKEDKRMSYEDFLEKEKLPTEKIKQRP